MFHVERGPSAVPPPRRPRRPAGPLRAGPGCRAPHPPVVAARADVPLAYPAERRVARGAVAPVSLSLSDRPGDAPGTPGDVACSKPTQHSTWIEGWVSHGSSDWPDVLSPRVPGIAAGAMPHSQPSAPRVPPCIRLEPRRIPQTTRSFHVTKTSGTPGAATRRGPGRPTPCTASAAPPQAKAPPGTVFHVEQGRPVGFNRPCGPVPPPVPYRAGASPSPRVAPAGQGPAAPHPPSEPHRASDISSPPPARGTRDRFLASLVSAGRRKLPERAMGTTPYGNRESAALEAERSSRERNERSRGGGRRTRPKFHVEHRHAPGATGRRQRGRPGRKPGPRAVCTGACTAGEDPRAGRGGAQHRVPGEPARGAGPLEVSHPPRSNTATERESPLKGRAYLRSERHLIPCRAAAASSSGRAGARPNMATTRPPPAR